VKSSGLIGKLNSNHPVKYTTDVTETAGLFPGMGSVFDMIMLHPPGHNFSRLT